jgi:hypothetical protein
VEALRTEWKRGEIGTNGADFGHVKACYGPGRTGEVLVRQMSGEPSCQEFTKNSDLIHLSNIDRCVAI